MYRWSKQIVSWRCGKVLHLSVVFSWQMGEAERLARGHNGPVKIGGPAAAMAKPEWAMFHAETAFDVLSAHNPFATFTTRGCPNRCPWCIVPKVEGGFRELERWKPAPLVCDNNLLAASGRHWDRVIESLRPFPYVDFNQGLDAQRFDPFHARAIAGLRGARVRFALDHTGQKFFVGRALEIARAAGLRDFGVYVLIGYDDNPEEARDRLETVRAWGREFGQRLYPNPMRYQPLDAQRKDEYIAPGWTEIELRRMMRYYSKLWWLEHIPYEEYCGTSHERDLLSVKKA